MTLDLHQEGGRAAAPRVDLTDGAVPGLTLRIGRTYGATWSLLLRIVGEGGVTGRGYAQKGAKHRVSLGSYPQVSLEIARAKANQCLDQAKRGERLIDELEQTATAGGLSIAALAERFLSDYVRLKELRAARKYEMSIRVHIVPEVGRVLADVLSRDQVRGLMKTVMVRVPRGVGGRDRPRGGKEAARTVVGVLRKMINWGIREKQLKRTDNPAIGMEDNLPKKRRKERVLSMEEARLAWRAAESLGYPFGPVYQLILLTGCRPGEWSACLRQYLDLKQGLLVLPAAAYKTDHVHVVPLVPQAMEILESVLGHHSGQSGEYLFSGTDGARRLSGWSKGHARMLRAICAESGERTVVPWTPHVLPLGFKRIRHYGLNANRNKAAKLAACRAALDAPVPPPPVVESAEAFLIRVSGGDPRLCPHCRQGRMVIFQQMPRPTRLPDLRATGPPASS